LRNIVSHPCEPTDRQLAVAADRSPIPGGSLANFTGGVKTAFQLANPAPSHPLAQRVFGELPARLPAPPDWPNPLPAAQNVFW